MDKDEWWTRDGMKKKNCVKFQRKSEMPVKVFKTNERDANTKMKAQPEKKS